MGRIINTINYEEFALDYIEGALSSEDRKAFQLFLANHPDVANELESFEVFELKPDTSVSYANQASLLKDTEKIYPSSSKKQWYIGLILFMIGIASFLSIYTMNKNEKTIESSTIETSNSTLLVETAETAETAETEETQINIQQLSTSVSKAIENKGIVNTDKKTTISINPVNKLDPNPTPTKTTTFNNPSFKINEEKEITVDTISKTLSNPIAQVERLPQAFESTSMIQSLAEEPTELIAVKLNLDPIAMETPVRNTTTVEDKQTIKEKVIDRIKVIASEMDPSSETIAEATISEKDFKKAFLPKFITQK